MKPSSQTLIDCLIKEFDHYCLDPSEYEFPAMECNPLTVGFGLHAMKVYQQIVHVAESKNGEQPPPTSICHLDIASECKRVLRTEIIET